MASNRARRRPAWEADSPRCRPSASEVTAPSRWSASRSARSVSSSAAMHGSCARSAPERASPTHEQGSIRCRRCAAPAPQATLNPVPRAQEETTMGPFPHDAPKATDHRSRNPAGTDGFEFVEFAHEDPEAAPRDLPPPGLRPRRQSQDQGRGAVAAGRHHLRRSTPSPARTRCASWPSTAPARPRWPGAWSMRATPTSTRSRRAPSPTMRTTE